ncbi:MAG: MBL fold metallo-hydrolase [Synergistaceae bacterium]|jgi:glyoxylase-like metal-dependent hydrolase (beta-lactamase superfamily II)|nr:MBL fold metallo-hydrolase [Synergistaceae bacterium]
MDETLCVDYKNGVYCVESGYEGGGVVSVYIVRDGGTAAIIDTAHNAALAPVKEAMREIGIASDEVGYIFLTHVHLDHAGGAGLFAAEFANAAVVVHERGARHIVDPKRLVKGASEVYGASEMARLYGEVVPVPKGRVISPRDGDEFSVGERKIACLDTPGHARHHLAFYDAGSKAVFTGDAFGMSYRELTGPGGRCAIPTTSPVQFDPNAMRESMRKIEGMKPLILYLTHYGKIDFSEKLSSSLHRQLDTFVEIAESACGDLDEIRSGIRELFVKESAIQGCPCMASDTGRVTGRALELNSLGLAQWYKKERDRLGKML